MSSFFKNLINLVLNNGLSAKWMLDYFELGFISLEKVKFQFKDHYMVIFATPHIKN